LSAGTGFVTAPADKGAPNFPQVIVVQALAH